MNPVLPAPNIEGLFSWKATNKMIAYRTELHCVTDVLKSIQIYYR